MNRIALAPLTALVAGCLIAGQASAADPAHAKNAVQGQKIDSGLGDLPHYRFWADKSGKNSSQTRVVGEKLDSGLGDIAPFSLDKNGRPKGVDVAQHQ